MKVVFALLFTLLLSESIYADITVGTEKPAASNISNQYIPSNSDRFGSNPGVTHLDMHGINALPAPRAVQKGASGSRSTGSTSSNPGYTSNVNYLVRRNLLDVHGINALPAPQAVHTETLSAGIPPFDSKPGANNESYIPMPKTPAIALHGMLDSISQYPESSLVNNSSRNVTPKADSVEDSGEREIISLKHLPKNNPLMLHSMLDSISRESSSGKGPSSPDGNKPGGDGTVPPPLPSSGDGSGKKSASMRGASGESTHLDSNGRWHSDPRNNVTLSPQIRMAEELTSTQQDMVKDGVTDIAVLSSVDRHRTSSALSKKNNGDNKQPDNVRGVSSEVTSLEGTTLYSAPKTFPNRKKTQVLLIGQEAETARELLERNPDSLESQRLGCRLSFW